MTKSSAISIPALKACNICASTEGTRFYLKGVYVTISARAAIYVATDGHCMLVHREDLAEDAEVNTLLGSWIIPSDTIAKLKAPKRGPCFLSEMDGGKLLIIAGEAESLCKPIDGTFPDWRRVIPAALDPAKAPERPQFNPAYVGAFGKVAKELDLGLPHFHYGNAGDPCAVTFSRGSKTFGVLMPLRNEADPWAGAPDWVNLG